MSFLESNRKKQKEFTIDEMENYIEQFVKPSTYPPLLAEEMLMQAVAMLRSTT